MGLCFIKSFILLNIYCPVRYRGWRARRLHALIIGVVDLWVTIGRHPIVGGRSVPVWEGKVMIVFLRG